MKGNSSKDPISSLEFLTEPYSNQSGFDPNRIIGSMQKFESRISELLEELPQAKNKTDVLAEIRKGVNGITSMDNARSSFYSFDREPLKKKLAEKIKNRLKDIIQAKMLEKQKLQLLLIYLQLVVEDGWYRELEIAGDAVNELISVKAFPNLLKTLHLFLNAITFAKLMLHLDLSKERYELRCLLQKFKDGESLEEQLSITAFKLLVHARQKWLGHFIRTRTTITIIEDPAAYSYKFCHAIGQLYLQHLDHADRNLWDIFNYPGIFLDLIYFEREDLHKVKQVVEIYKKADFKTQQAIESELKNRKSVSDLLNRLLTLSKAVELHHDATLVYSEIYFTEGLDTQWADSCQSIGYLIVRYDQGWVSLYNTQMGYMTHETGTLFDAEMLDSSKENLVFKVLKRDGWHFYKAIGGLDVQNWDDIELLSVSDYYKNNPGYSVCKKDKILYLFEHRGGKIVKELPEATALRFIVQNPTRLFAVKIKNYWQLYDLAADQYVKNYPAEVHAVDKIKDSNNYVLLKDKRGKYFLYDLADKKYFQLEGVKALHFVSFSDVIGENDDGSFFSIRDCQHKIMITKQLFNRLAAYQLANKESYVGLQMTGMGIFQGGNVARYDYQMELQGRYYITKYADNSILWLHNTVGGITGRATTLYQGADNIYYLGISQTIYNDRKVFFLIEQGQEIWLYVSYYSRLKQLSDRNENIEEKQAPHDLIGLPSKDIVFLYGNYLRILINGQWQIYEHLFGCHPDIDAEKIVPLDYRSFLKIKKFGSWYLYDLDKRQMVAVQGAKAIELSAENKIVFIYDNYIRYLSYDNLPKCVPAQLLSQVSTKEEVNNPFFNNYMANVIKLEECTGLTLNHIQQPFANVLLALVDHQLLKKIDSLYILKIAELFDGKSCDFSSISEKLVEIVALARFYINALQEATGKLSEDEKSIKLNIRVLSREIAELESSLYASFSIKEEVVSGLEIINVDKLTEIENNLRQLESEKSNDLIKEIVKLKTKINNFKLCLIQKQQQKAQEKQMLLAMLKQHRHMLSGVLRYWLSIDANGEHIEILHHHLIALVDLYQRNDKDEKSQTIIRKHYLTIIKLYDFDAGFINNYIIAEVDDLNVIQDLLALLDLLRRDEREITIFKSILKFGPTLHEHYEELSKEELELEYSRLKEYMHALRLMAIANELKNESLYKLEMKKYKSVSNSHSQLIKDMAQQIIKDFYKNLGIEVDESNKFNIDIVYMVDIMYASENFKDNDKIILLLLLKAAIYQLDLKQLFTAALPVDLQNRFSKKELVLLQSLQEHNKKVQLEFQSRKIDWDLWQKGIKEIEGANVSIAVWQRNVSHDLFQGEFCNSCISMVKGNARANLYYLTDFNFSMLEIIEKEHKKTIGHVTIWIGETSDKELILVLNSIQIHRRYEKNGQEIRDLIFEYVHSFSQQLGIHSVVLGQGYNAVPLQILREIDDVCQEDESRKSFFIQSTKNLKQEQKTVQIEDLQTQIICSTFIDEMYSDVYFDGWVNVKDMMEEDAKVWDLSLFLHQAFNPFKKSDKSSLGFLKKYEVWVIDNSEFKSIVVCDHKFNSVVLISKAYWQRYQTNITDRIKDEITAYENLTKRKFKGIETKAEKNEDLIIFEDSDQEQETNSIEFDFSNFINFQAVSASEYDHEEVEHIKKESVVTAKKQANIGARQIPGYILRDVAGEGNCFYLAVADQLYLTKHPFIKQVPYGTEAHDSLRLRVQGQAFTDKEWADHAEIMEVCMKLNLIVAVIDTRYPAVGFVYYYIDYNNEPTSQKNLRGLPQKSIVRISFTGNHYLSIRAYPELLETIVCNYTLGGMRVRHGFWVGQLPSHLREIDAEIKQIRAATSTAKVIIMRLQRIIQHAQFMGKQHPVLLVARKCLGMYINANKTYVNSHQQPTITFSGNSYTEILSSPVSDLPESEYTGFEDVLLEMLRKPEEVINKQQEEIQRNYLALNQATSTQKKEESVDEYDPLLDSEQDFTSEGEYSDEKEECLSGYSN